MRAETLANRLMEDTQKLIEERIAQLGVDDKVDKPFKTLIQHCKIMEAKINDLTKVIYA